MNLNDAPYDALERIFHEPNRLAIMSALASADQGLRFGDLKQVCNLTDGNLNRHLKALDEAKAISIWKRFVKGKPCTTVSISKIGLKRFTEYLSALEKVLESAKTAVSEETKEEGGMLGGFQNA